jgi:O-antigen ligase
MGPWWWRLVPFLAILGIVCTGSRAAQIAVIVVLIATFFQAFRRWRWTIVLLGVLATVGFEAYRDNIVELMGKYISENKEGIEYVTINGVKRPYTGTLHRDLLFEVYEEAIEKNDWLGYGSSQSSMERMPVDPVMDSRFKSIDNHYLMWFLQFGYLGLTLFAILAISLVCNLLSPLLHGRGAPGRLAGGLFGAMVGTLIAMRGVWFASDYAWVWLFCGGLSTCLSRLREPAAEGDVPLE